MLEVGSPVTTHDPAVDARLALVWSWDFDRERRLLARDGLDEAEIKAIEHEYRKYHTICVVFPDSSHPMTRRVDPFWHAHILNTRGYEEFCQKVYGRFRHHRPALTDAEGKRLNREYHAETLPHLQQLFGEVSTAMWPPFGAVCVCCLGDTV